MELDISYLASADAVCAMCLGRLLVRRIFWTDWIVRKVLLNAEFISCVMGSVRYSEHYTYDCDLLMIHYSRNLVTRTLLVDSSTTESGSTVIGCLHVKYVMYLVPIAAA